MKLFKVNDTISIVCESKPTRTAFKHEATLIIGNTSFETVKICYLNRTWERFTFESVMKKLVEKSTRLSDEEKKEISMFIELDALLI